MLEPDDRLRQHLYTAAGAGAGIVSIVINVIAGGPPSFADLTFMLLGLVLLTCIPLRPLPVSLAYLACWSVLVLAPGVYAGDMIITDLGFFVFLGRFLRPLPAFTLFLATVGVSVVAILIQPPIYLANSIEAVTTLFLIGLLMVPMGILLRATERARYMESKLAKARLDAMRLEIAREMHDLVAYSMSQTALRAQRAAANSAFSAPARQEFTALECTAADALHELRLLLRTLREDPGPNKQEDPDQTVTNLGHLVTDLSTAVQAVGDDVAAAGFDVTYQWIGTLVPTRAQAVTLSRVAREMGANIIRHGDIDHHVTLTLTLGPEFIRLVATNKINQGAPRLPYSGSGVLGMRERLNAIGGTLSTLSEDGTWMAVATVLCPSTTPSNPQPLEKTS